MRSRALWKSARSDVGQTPDTGGLARRAPAPKRSGASVLEESRSHVFLENGNGASGTLEGSRGVMTQRILEQIQMGRTVYAISTATGVSEVFVSTLLEHYDWLGAFDDAGPPCSSGLGTCHTKNISGEVRVACAGCSLVIWGGVRSSGSEQWPSAPGASRALKRFMVTPPVMPGAPGASFPDEKPTRYRFHGALRIGAMNS